MDRYGKELATKSSGTGLKHLLLEYDQTRRAFGNYSAETKECEGRVNLRAWYYRPRTVGNLTHKFVVVLPGTVHSAKKNEGLLTLQGHNSITKLAEGNSITRGRIIYYWSSLKLLVSTLHHMTTAPWLIVH